MPVLSSPRSVPSLSPSLSSSTSMAQPFAHAPSSPRPSPTGQRRWRTRARSRLPRMACRGGGPPTTAAMPPGPAMRGPLLPRESTRQMPNGRGSRWRTRSEECWPPSSDFLSSPSHFICIFSHSLFSIPSYIIHTISCPLFHVERVGSRHGFVSFSSPYRTRAVPCCILTSSYLFAFFIAK